MANASQHSEPTQTESGRTAFSGNVLYRAFHLPVAVLLLGCVPGLNLFLYSGHGGIFWLLLPLCFPYVLVRLLLALRGLPSAEKKSGSRIGAAAILVYILVAYPLTRWTEYYVSSRIGLQIHTGTMFRLATFPVGYLLPPYDSKSNR